MKRILHIVILISLSQITFAQNISETVAKFWDAVDTYQHEKVIQNGEVLLEHFKKNNFIIDSTIVYIRVFLANSLSEIGYYQKSLNLNINTYNQIIKSNIKERKFEVAVLNNIALNHDALGNYNKAIELNLKVLEIDKKTVGKRHPNYAKTLNNLALNYSKMGDYATSLEYNLQALEIYEKVIGKAHPDYATSLNNIAMNYSDMGDYAKSLEYNLQALKIREKELGKEHPKYATSLNNIALNYSSMGDYATSLEYNFQALKIIEKALGNVHPSYATSLNNIALNYSNMGDYVKSLEYNLQALDIKEIALGKEHPDYATSLKTIAMNYSDMGDYAKSLEYNLQALNIIEKALGKEHPAYATSLNNIAMAYLYIGDYTKSLEYNFQALKIREKALGKEHSDYAMSLNNIAMAYLYIGDYTKSLEYNFQALNIYEKTLGKAHPDYATSLNNIAQNYSSMGDYAKSLQYNLQALEIYEKALGKEHPNYAMSLNNIAGDYWSMGDYTKSLEYNFQALKIREKALGKEHPGYAKSLNNIAVNYSSMGDYPKSLEFNLQALGIKEKVLGRMHPDYAMSLNNIAVNYSEMGDYAKALEYNIQVLKIREKALSKEHPDYAMSLNNIAMDYFDISNYSKSLEFNLQALGIKEKVLGRMHPDYATSLNNIGFNYAQTGNINKASKHLSEAHAIREHSFNQNKFGLHSSLLETNKKPLEHSFKLIGGLLYRDSSISQFVGQSWLNLNGVISSNQQHLEREILSSGDTSMVRIMEELKLSKLQLSKYQELTIQEKQERGIDEEALENQINSYERQLSAKSQSFADFNRYFSASDVSNVLEHNECFVDIARVPYYSFYSNDWTDSVNYIVFVHTPTDTLIDYFFITNGNALEYDVIDHYADFTSGEYKTIDVKDHISYENFWKPIAARIGSATTVYVSAGGIYNNINLNTLFNPETDNYLLHEKDIRMVNSARDFVLMKERDNQDYTTNTVALFGYPNYDGSTITKTIDTLDYLSIVRDLPLGLDSLTRGGMKASLLPGTKTEVKNISSTFTKNKWNTSIFIENEASEENIKQLTSPRVLHIATHGYFFEDIQVDFKQDRFMGMDRKQVIDNPLLRSGLLLAGANQTLQGEEVKGENGLLSAYEASLLDLRKTELVVLSACETGKGEVKNSEGVYGLRKAFADAGAKNIIMSLWKVDDAVTQEFMTLFYEIWLNDKTSIREAFNRTQLEIKAKYPQPYYWGAFILVGG